MDFVTRQFDAAMETRASDGDETESLNVRGHAAVFSEQTLIGTRQHGFVEQIEPGAFTDNLADDVRYLENHAGLPLARTKSGTLRLSVDERGLVVDADLNPIAGRDHFSAIERGDLDQMSFAFTIEDDEVRMLPEDHPTFPGMVERTIKRVSQLYDVSGVTYPAYEGADIGVRNNKELREDIDSVLTRAQALETDLPEVSASEETNANPQDEMTVERAKALAAAERHLTNTQEIQ